MDNRPSTGVKEVRPPAWACDVTPYSPPRPAAPITLKLDANEGAAPAPWARDVLSSLDPEALRRYPRPREFESFLAARLGVDASRVLVTAGGDDAIDRVCRVALGPDRELVLPVPTFEMIARYAAIAGATAREVEWAGGAFPVDAVRGAMSRRTGMVAVVSPNNPTGATIDERGFRQVADVAAERGALVLADFAYAEFALEDLTPLALSFPNVVVVRTLSKAWGLAGLRVGYALGPPVVIAWLRAAGNPYAVSGPSLAVARAVLERGEEALRESVARSRAERGALRELLRGFGIDAGDSQGNFVFCRTGAADRVRAGLAQRGIGVRGFPGDPRLADALRITVPCDERGLALLERALKEVMSGVATRGEMP